MTITREDLVDLSKKEAHAYVDYLMNKWTNRT